MFDSAMAGGFAVVEAKLRAAPTAEPAGMLHQCIKATLGRFDKTDAVVYRWQLSILASMLPMMALQPALATPFLQTIFQAVRFQLGEDDNTGIGQTNGAKVRRVGATMLIKLLSKSGASLFKMLPAIVAEVQAVLALPATSEIMRTLLIEALIKAGNKLESAQQHAELLRLLLTPVATQFASAAFASHIASAESFAAHGGLSAAPAAAHLTNRQQVTYSVQTMASALVMTDGRDPGTGAVAAVDVPYNGDGGSSSGGDGLAYACQAQTQTVLQHTFQAIKVLHSLWVPGCTAIPDAVRAVLEMRHSEKSGLLSKAGKTIPRTSGEAEMWLDRSQLWLQSLREALYRVVACAAKQGLLFKIGPLSTVLATTCFADMAHMQPRHVVLLLKAIINPLLRFAPRTEAGVGTLLAPLAAFYTFCRAYLTQHFDGRKAAAAAAQAGGGGAAGGGGGGAAGEEDLHQDILIDVQIQNLCKDLAMHFRSILVPKAAAKEKGSVTLTSTHARTNHARRICYRA